MLTSLTLAAALITTTADAPVRPHPSEPSLASPPTRAIAPLHAGFSQPVDVPDAPNAVESAVDSIPQTPEEEVGPGEVSSDSACSCQSSPCGGGAYGGFGGSGFKPPRMEHCWTGRCDMPQHTPYYPPAHGNYYFRPYSVAQLASQQEFVMSWGGDPRDPYKNEIFQRVYDEMAAETGQSPVDAPPAEKGDTSDEGTAVPGDRTHFVPTTPKSLKYDEEARSIDGAARH